MPDQRIGYVLSAYEKNNSSNQPTRVWFKSASDPATLRAAYISAVSPSADLDSQIGSVLPVEAHIDRDHSSNQSFTLRPGTTVDAKIVCVQPPWATANCMSSSTGHGELGSNTSTNLVSTRASQMKQYLFLAIFVVLAGQTFAAESTISLSPSPSDQAPSILMLPAPDTAEVVAENPVDQQRKILLELNGVVEALQYLDVPARREGLLESLSINAGEVVEANEVIGVLNSDQEVKAYEKAQADFQFSKLNAENEFITEAIGQEMAGKRNDLSV